MKNSKQNIFSKADLTRLGFKREDAGGFYYYIKYLDENDQVNCEALVTQDVNVDEEEEEVRFYVNLAQEPVPSALSRKEISFYIDEFKQA